MKGLSIFLLFSFGAVNSYSQNITALEYFFDSDPGVGLATIIPIPNAGQELAIDAQISTDGLSVGMHTLFIRAKNDSSEWGLPIKKLIFVDQLNPLEEQHISGFEYFFDTDPGVGNGVPLAVDPANKTELIANLLTDGLSNGMHTLYIRAKQQDGIWGLPIKKLVFVEQSSPNRIGEIVAGEYFLNTDPGFAQATAFTIQPGTDIETTFNVSGSDLPIGNQILFVRVQDEFGRWSHYRSIAFNSVEVPFISFTNDVDTVSVTTGNDDISIFEDVSITASEGIGIDSALVSFQSGFLAAEDSLLLPSSEDFLIENEQEYIKVKGNGTISEYQDLFSELSYKNSSTFPSDTLKTVEFNVFSNGIATNSVTRVLDVRIDSIATSSEFNSDDDLPSTFSLDQNYPNPFNPSTTIQFGLPQASMVRLEVYNLLGQRVKELVTESLSAGFHSVQFEASELSSGIYIYRIQAGSFVQTKKMMLIK